MKKEKKGLKFLTVIKDIISWTILITIVVLIATIFISRITGNVPTIMGYSIYRVSTGSMEPELAVGDVILVKECEIEDLEKGDIVTYKGIKGNMAGKIITHRIVEAPYDIEGVSHVTTRGDANNMNDPPVPVDKIMGKMDRELPIFTACFNFFITPWGLLTVIALIVLAFFGDIINIIKALTSTDVKEKERTIEDIVRDIQKQDMEKADTEETFKEETVDEILEELREEKKEDS